MTKQNYRGMIAATWGVAGFLILLMFAIYRLAVVALDAASMTWHWYHWLVFFTNIGFMAYSEGYRGFQKGYSPRLVSNARLLLDNPTQVKIVLAPLFSMGYISADRRTVLRAWLITVMIVLLVIVFHQLPQPWRGVLDAGIVVGLSWGLLATLACALRQTPETPRVAKPGLQKGTIDEFRTM